MKPGLTAHRGQAKMARPKTPSKVGTAHNKDKGDSAEELVEGLMKRRGIFGSKFSKGFKPTRAEKDSAARGISTKLIEKVRKQNLEQQGIDVRKFK